MIQIITNSQRNYPFVFWIEIEILEWHFLVVLYRQVDFAYRIEDTFVGAFCRIELYDIAAQEFECGIKIRETL